MATEDRRPCNIKSGHHGFTRMSTGTSPGIESSEGDEVPKALLLAARRFVHTRSDPWLSPVLIRG